MSSPPPLLTQSAFVQPPRRITGRSGIRRHPIPGAFHPPADHSFSSAEDSRELLSTSLGTSPEGAPDLNHAILPRSGSSSGAMSGLPASRKRTWQPSNNYASLAGVTTTMDTGYEHPTMTAQEAVHASTLLRAQQERDEQQQQNAQQPAAKKRRGLAGTIVDGALSGLIYGGAAALTAYSLWSSWGAKPESGEQQQQAQAQEPPKHEKAAGEDGDHVPPPPPYDGTPSAFTGRASPAPSRTPRRQQQRNVYVSGNRNRRRRPVFHSARSNSSRSLATTAPSVGSSVDDAAVNGSDPPADGDAGSDSDSDEQYLRFQQQMATLIAQGQAALQSTPTVGDDEHDDDDDDVYMRRSPSPSKRTYHTPRTPTRSRIPQIKADSPSSFAQPSFRGANDVNFNFGAGADTSAFRSSPLARSSGLPTLIPRSDDSGSASAVPTMRPSGSRPFVFGSTQPTNEYETPVRRAGGTPSAFRRQPASASGGRNSATSTPSSPYSRRTTTATHRFV